MILSEIENTQARDMITTDPDMTRNRSLSWAFQPMAGGGAVVLLEDITERRDAEARISHLARYDELTELPNRVNFRDEIGRLLAAQQGADRLSALLFVDLDQFKQVNDTLGHPCGDQLLCAVASRLREMLRPEDFVARFGGDEFVVFQQNINSHEDAAGLARRIVDRLSERYKIDNHLVEIGASVGIAMTSAGVADTLLKNADMALYRAKADGRGTFCFFRDEMAQIVEARRILELESRIKKPVIEGQIPDVADLGFGVVARIHLVPRFDFRRAAPALVGQIAVHLDRSGRATDVDGVARERRLRERR
jgi:diguanylate cyclase (GGDEF)-like protein